MKNIALLILLVSFLSESFGQKVWTKYSSNPVLQPGVSGTWDDSAIFVPSVLLDGSSYRMWYGGNDGINFRIGHAISSDGITWIKDTLNNPVLDLGNPGEWDDNFVYTPKVVFNGTIYHMWYTGNDGLNNERIGHATSPDGINWTKDPLNPVVTPGSSGSWDDEIVAGGQVFLEGSIFHMWYAGFNGSVWGIGHATSTDGGSSWTKDPSNPVLTVGLSNEWDFPMLQSGSVIYEPLTSVYYLFYGGGEFNSWEIGYATSLDINGPWIKNITNPILSQTPSGWDGLFVGTPNVIYDQITSNFKMWYSGGNTAFVSSIGYATAPTVLRDTIHVPADYTTIQAGINAAQNGDMVLVDDGTYLENINYKGKAITVASNFIIDEDTNHISNTVIDGSQPSHPDSGSVVTFNSGEDTTSVLCGFTITGGTGTFIPAVPFPFSARIGGGIYIGANVGASILNNMIKHNNILTNDYAAGGGIYSDDPGGNGFSIIENNTIRNNSILGGNQLIMGGGICMGGSGRIVNNYIIENTCQSMGSSLGAVGGGVKLWTLDGSQDTTSCLIENNIISDNKSISVNGTAYAGGINSSNCVITMRSNVVCNNTAEGSVQSIGAGMHVGGLINLESRIENNRFTGNHFIGTGTSYGGALYINNSIPVVINNIFNNNEANYGGGICLNNNSQLELTNNTIVSNTASIVGGGIYSNQSILTVMNSIIWDNSAPNGSQISLSGGTSDVTYSDIEGGWTGTGNIDLNPELMDTVLTSGDTLFAILSIGSPCIDAGNSDPLFNDPEDPINPGYALFPSRGTTRNDMGAYGSPGAKEWGIVTDINEEFQYSNEIPSGFQLSQNYPNPFNPSTKISWQSPVGSWQTLKVYDILGNEVSKLVDEYKPAGKYEVELSIYSGEGRNLSSGVYFYRLHAGTFVETKKMLLLK